MAYPTLLEDTMTKGCFDRYDRWDEQEDAPYPPDLAKEAQTLVWVSLYDHHALQFAVAVPNTARDILVAWQLLETRQAACLRPWLTIEEHRGQHHHA